MNTEQVFAFATRLEAKVAARNKVHDIARRYWPSIRSILAAEVGKKIVNADGSFVARLRKFLQPSASFEVNEHCSLWYHKGTGTIWACFKTSCRSNGNTPDYQVASYAEVTVPIATHNNGILESVPDIYHLRTDYTVAEVQSERQKLRSLRTQLSQVENDIRLFGEHDNF